MSIIKKIVGALFGGARIKNVEGNIELWRSLCEEKGGKIERVYDSAHIYLTLKMTLPVGQSKIEIRESDLKPLKITCTTPSGSGLNFDMWIADWSDKIMGSMGGKDDLIGDRQLDKKYVFQTENKRDLQQLFQDDRIRDLLNTYNVYSLGTKTDAGNTIIDATLIKTVTKEETIRDFYDLFSSLLVRMEKLGIISPE